MTVSSRPNTTARPAITPAIAAHSLRLLSFLIKVSIVNQLLLLMKTLEILDAMIHNFYLFLNNGFLFLELIDAFNNTVMLLDLFLELFDTIIGQSVGC
jgi:hypothetical protein